jgi:hypothetical protein
MTASVLGTSTAPSRRNLVLACLLACSQALSEPDPSSPALVDLGFAQRREVGIRRDEMHLDGYLDGARSP